MVMRLDRDLLRQGGRAWTRRRTGAAAPPAAVLSRRALGPSVFSTTWAYIDQVLVPPGASTKEMKHDTVGEAYYVLAGNGTVTVKGTASETAPIRTGDAIPDQDRRIECVHEYRFRAARTFCMGVAKDMAAKTQLLSAGNQR